MNRKLFIGITGILIAAALIAGCELGDSSTAAKPIVKPYISIQPIGGSFFTDAYTAPVLKVEVYDWNKSDGSLSFQWYEFTDIEEYCNNKGGTAINGAKDTEYTPSLTPAADEIHYFYVVVTNSDSSAQGAKKASIQSEVIAISFSNPGEPLYPVVTANPASATYGWGALLNPLKVAALLPKDAPGQLSYLWYSNEAYGIIGGVPIENADKTSITPNPAELNLNENYFFAKVTNTIGNAKKTSTTVPAIITIKPGKRAAAPRITTQPKDAIYITDNPTIAPLTVEAESLDMGTLSYQWYSNTDTKNTGGTLIQNATDKTFNIPSAASGSSYYYVVVTNTNNNVESENKTASIASNPVKIRIGNGTGGTTANAFFTIPDTKVPANRFQYVRGYGGMDVAWGNFPRTTKADTELMYDPNKLGYNMLRIMIRADNIDIEKTMRDLVAGDRPDYYENVKIVNKYGGYVAASPWTPPKEWKSNNSINGGGYLIKSYYKLFANYLRNFAQHMYDNGAPIFAISISNEPNYTAGYDGCEWTPEEMRDFFIEVGHFTDGIRGYGGSRETPYVWVMNGESANTPVINVAALEDSRSKAVIDVLARHVYGSRTVSLWNDSSPSKVPYRDLLRKPDGSYLEVWMTEHNINSANATGYLNDSKWNYVWRFMNDVDLVIRLNNENAFVWWAGKRFYSMVGDGQAGTTDGAALPRGYGLSHYAKFTSDTTRVNVVLVPTATRLSTYKGGPLPEGYTVREIRHTDRATSMVNRSGDNMDNNSARITAFESADGNSISMVLMTPTLTSGSDGIDMGTVEIALPPGFIANSVVAAKSWGDRGTQMMQPDDSVALNADRDKVYVTIGAGELFSVRVSR